MKTVCIETNPSAAIGWWIRYSDENILYTTYPDVVDDKIRNHNLARFNKEVNIMTKNELWNLLQDDNNIQIISNEGIQKIPWLYKDPEHHPILSKTWIIDMLTSHQLACYLPKSFIIPKDHVSLDTIIHHIQTNFLSWSKIVVKNAGIDGNWSWVWIVKYWSDLRENVSLILQKFSKHFWWDQHKVFGYDYLIQEYISDILWEWSITFSIQNRNIECLWLANNVVLWWEYFWSTNVFPYLNKDQSTAILQQIQKDFLPLLYKLQQEWIRWNVWFDIVFKNEWEFVKPYVLECNGIHRMTWSLLPNNFAYSTKNDVFVWIPLAKKYLWKDIQSMGQRELLLLADKFQSYWNKEGNAQIINIKSEWSEWWHPAMRISLAWPSQKELFQLFCDSKITNNMWKRYTNDVFEKMVI